MYEVYGLVLYTQQSYACVDNDAGIFTTTGPPLRNCLINSSVLVIDYFFYFTSSVTNRETKGNSIQKKTCSHALQVI